MTIISTGTYYNTFTCFSSFIFRLSCCAWPVFAVVSRQQSRPGCPAPVVLSVNILALQYKLSSFVCPVTTVLSWLFYLDWLFLGVLSWLCCLCWNDRIGCPSLVTVLTVPPDISVTAGLVSCSGCSTRSNNKKWKLNRRKLKEKLVHRSVSRWWYCRQNLPREGAISVYGWFFFEEIHRKLATPREF